MTPTIWSRTARDLLFEELVKQFGPYKTWKRAEYPSKAKQKEFVKFCVDIAALVGAKSWREAGSGSILWWPAGFSNDGAAALNVVFKYFVLKASKKRLF